MQFFSIQVLFLLFLLFLCPDFGKQSELNLNNFIWT
jgi:hypothetical protein